MILETLKLIKKNIALRCDKAARDISEIKIIAVSKNTGLNLINQAIDAGIVDLGENKAQELSEKFPLIDKNVNWHFLGHLQRNKVKQVVELSGLIHSVDSLRLAEEINKQAQKCGKIQKVLLEVKTSDEATKYGITQVSELLEIASFCLNAPNIELTGLMTLAPFTDNEELIRKCFSDLRKLKTMLCEKGIIISELSMGMSHDYEIAIEEGATMIRLGTAIFGPRDYSKSWKEQ
jgi:pyridoxal phosphate enzyme (YggS family)